MGGRGEECFQKEGAELGSKAGRERDSKNISASWGQAQGVPVTSARGLCTMKDPLWAQASRSDRSGCQMQGSLLSSTCL